MKRDAQVQKLRMEAEHAALQLHTRRHFLKEGAMGFGALALGSLLGSCGFGGSSAPNAMLDASNPLAPRP
ncbi:MAG: twin-arginine translocation signal domain-containing protein, partial [Sphingobacterium thalpophilum]